MANLYGASWKEPENYAEAMESFTHAACLVANSGDILERHKIQILDTIVWKASEAAGKNKKDTRFVTEAVYEADKAGTSIETNFEHVRPKKKVIRDLLASPETAKSILYNAIACTVTRNEHKLLRDGENWDRYRAAKLRVYDRLENKFIDFS